MEGGNTEIVLEAVCMESGSTESVLEAVRVKSGSADSVQGADCVEVRSTETFLEADHVGNVVTTRQFWRPSAWEAVAMNEFRRLPWWPGR